MSQGSAKSVYFDNAATSFPKPESVYAAVDQWMRRGGVSFGRGGHAGTSTTSKMVNETRHVLAELLNAGSADRIAFTSNGTDSLHLLLHGLIRPGDAVVATALDHNSVTRPLHLLSERDDVSIFRADFDADTGLVSIVQFQQLLADHQPRIAILNHASNVTGVVQPVKQMIQLAHQAGAFVVLDAAQTVGHIPIDLQDLNVDFMAAAGHKGLLGPLGTGIVYVAHDLEYQLLPVRTGGTGSDSEQAEHPSAMPGRLESGNLNIPGIAGLGIAAHWLQSETVETVLDRTSHLESFIVKSLRDIPNVKIYCRSQSNSASSFDTTSVISFSIEGTDSREVGVILDQSFGIQVRTGLHCAPLAHATLGTTENGGTIRISCGAFTTQEEAKHLIDAIGQISESMTFV